MCTISLSCYRKHFLQILQGLPVLVKQNRVFSMITCLMFKKFEKIVNILLHLSAKGWQNLVILVNGSCLTHCWQLNRNGYTIINAWKYLVLCNRSPHQSSRFDASHSWRILKALIFWTEPQILNIIHFILITLFFYFIFQSFTSSPDRQMLK